MERSPGSYGPEFLEPGFKKNGGYFSAGFQANVNHYGGNLTVSATDVSIPGQGKFALAFTRTFNSNSLFLPDQAISNQADSPLGEGWIGHYSLLWGAGVLPGGGAVPHPEFVDSSGARHRFYRHDHLNTNTQIPIVSPGNNDEWITASMEILLKIDDDTYEMLTPGGLKYTLVRLYNVDNSLRYHYFVPTQISDCYANTWDITYEADIAPYFEHPLVQSIADGLGRTLDFEYSPDQLGKKRLDKVKFGGTVFAEYVYEHDGTHGFLKEHRTGEGRVTKYTNDIAPAANAAGSVINAITGIESPTGGVTVIHYDLKRIFYQSLAQTWAYAVTRIEKGGHTWDYNYLNTGPNAPQNNEFKVQVTTTNFEGTYTYHTYGSSAVWNSQLWKVGMLVHCEEKFRVGAIWTETEKTWDYAPFEVSTESQAANSLSLVSAPRLLSETAVQDGHSLTTTYPNEMYDTLNFPQWIHRPGNVTEEIEYHHVKSGIGGANPKYLLGLRASETVKFVFDTVNKIVRRHPNYPNLGAIAPDYIRFYRNANDYLQVDRDYYWTNGGAGSLKSIAYGGYSESYEYQNGVVEKLKYPEGPDIERVINQNGTIKEETRNGVKKSFTWDNDFRLELVQAPDTDDTIIDYDDRNNIVTFTQGPTQIKLVHDQWGRLVERREKVDGGQHAVETYSNFDAFDRPAQETIRTGATYNLTYDVQGRLRSRTVQGDAHTYDYTTDANGVKTTEILNGSVVMEREVDFLGRIRMGSTNGDQVDYSYASVNDGIRQTITFPQGQAQRTVVRDFLGNKVSETHPETGAIDYGYSPELWLNEVKRPGVDYTFIHDLRGRVKEVKHTGGATISTQNYHPTFGFVSRTEHNGVIVEDLDPDQAGRPQTVKWSVPRPLPIPHVTHPLGHLNPAVPFENAFIWDAVQDADGNLADSYDFELWQGAWSSVLIRSLPRGQYPPRLLHRKEIKDTKVLFSDIAFTPAGDQWYWFRVRAKRANGEIGPFCRPHSFVIGTPITVGQNFGAIPVKPEGLPTEQRPPLNTSDDVVDPIGDEDLFLAPKPQPMTSHAVFVVEIEYDGLGRISGVKHPDEDLTHVVGNWQKYGFNSQTSHKNVSYSGNPIVGDTAYWDSGLPRTMQMPMWSSVSANFVVDRSYDELGRIESHSVTMNNESVIYRASQINYYDDGFGYIKSLDRNDPGLRNTTIGYTYYPWGPLETFTVGGAVNTYVYDNAGNLTTQTGLNVLGLTATDIHNNPVPARLDLPSFRGINYNNSNQRIGWGYDLDGRLTRDDQWEYTYTDLNQIAIVIDPALGWAKAHYLYDADGNRVREVHDHQVTYSIRLPNGQLISQETQFHSYDWTGVKQDFVYHNGLPIAQVRYGKNIEYEFRDRLGNPVVAVQWPLVKYYEYAPYGYQMRTEVLFNLMAMEFTGHERDRYTGRDYMMARYYDSRAGRFNRPDPAFDFDETNPFSYNLYQYVRGNPVNYQDTSGRDTVIIITQDYTFGSHAAVRIDNNGDPVLYDPGGSYVPTHARGQPLRDAEGNPLRGNNDAFYGDAADLDAFIKYHESTGSKVKTYRFKTTLKQEKQIAERIDYRGQGYRGGQCSIGVCEMLSGIAPFTDLGISWFPGNLAGDLELLKRQEQYLLYGNFAF